MNILKDFKNLHSDGRFMRLPSNEKSDVERELGNLFFRQGNNYSALAHYNKALAFGHEDKERIALCYANRSAVYLELKHFKHCLQNIDMAEPNYPKDKIQKLHDRRQKCLKMMEDCADKMLEPFDHTFKLSHEPNPKLPFFIDALELREDDKLSKHLITTRDLKAGDVIAVIDKPLKETGANIVEQRQLVIGCYNCTKLNNLNLIAGNCQALFCSEKCKTEHELNNPHHESLHEMENQGVYKGHTMTVKFFLKFHDVFRNIDDMREFVEQHAEEKFSVFDIDWNLPEDDPTYIKNLLLTIMSVKDQKIPLNIRKVWERDFIGGFVSDLKPENRFKNIIETNQRHTEFLQKVVKQLCSFYEHCLASVIMETNRDNTLGLYFHPAMAAANSSCDPNVFVKVNNSKEIVWIVNQPIAAGSEIFLLQGDRLFYAVEASKSSPCQPKANCQPCRENWSAKFNVEALFDDMTKKTSFFKTKADVENKEKLLKYLKNCCDFINKNYRVDYYKNKNLLQQICLNKMRIAMTLTTINNPFPPSNFFYMRIPQTKSEMEEYSRNSFAIHNERIFPN